MSQIERLFSQCRCQTCSVPDLLDIIESQALPFLEAYNKGKRKKKRKRDAVEQRQQELDDEIEVPWLKKQPKLDSQASSSSPPPPPPPGGEPTPQIGPINPNIESTDTRPFSVFRVDGDETATKALRHRLITWISQPDKLGRNALHLAAFHGNENAIKVLTLKDASGTALIDIHSVAQDGTQAIHFAASGGHVNAVKLCVRLGSRVNAATSKGRKTALAFAEAKQHTDVIDYLVSKGAKTFPKEEETKASESGNDDADASQREANEDDGGSGGEAGA